MALERGKEGRREEQEVTQMSRINHISDTFTFFPSKLLHKHRYPCLFISPFLLLLELLELVSFLAPPDFAKKGNTKNLLDLMYTTTTKLLQSCLTLCNPIGGSPPGSPVPGILQARTLEWVAISFSNAWKWKVKVKSLSRVWPSATPWTAAFQAPLSMGFSRQEYWSGVPLP